MLWIVGFWHMGEVSGFHSSNTATYLLTIGALSTFVYVSAFLASRHTFESASDVVKFYIKRVIRIYPLFLLASTMLLLYSKDISFEQYIKSILGISLFIPAAPKTIWFINLMFVYWLITPLILWKNKINRIIILICFCLIAFLVFGLGTDERIFLYFPSYICGLIKGKGVTACSEPEPRATIMRVILCGVLFFISFSCYEAVNNMFLEYILKWSACWAIGTLLIYIGKYSKSCTMIGWLSIKISYASMCAYLFHRIFFAFFYNMVGTFHIAFSYFVVLPTILICSYGLQMCYDKIYGRII